MQGRDHSTEKTENHHQQSLPTNPVFYFIIQFSFKKKTFVANEKDTEEILPSFVTTGLSTLNTTETKKEDYLNESEEDIIFAPFSPGHTQPKDKVAMWPDERRRANHNNECDSPTIIISPPRQTKKNTKEEEELIKIYKSDRGKDLEHKDTARFVQGNKTNPFIQGNIFFNF